VVKCGYFHQFILYLKMCILPQLRNGDNIALSKNMLIIIAVIAVAAVVVAAAVALSAGGNDG